MKPRAWLVALAALLAAGGLFFWWSNHPTDHPGCAAYTPVPGLLVAHAGGGLPDATYVDDERALDLAAKHGFTLVELDFIERDGEMMIGHDRPGPLSVERLATWLKAHPGIDVVTDIKTDNLSGLAKLLRTLPAQRLIPQIYQPAQYAPARALGFDRIIFAERIGESRDWFPWVNRTGLWAVTLPWDKAEWREKIRHRVFLYTVDRPGYGDVYTDCLIPQATGS